MALNLGLHRIQAEELHREVLWRRPEPRQRIGRAFRWSHHRHAFDLASTKPYGPKNHGANSPASPLVTTVDDLGDRDDGPMHEPASAFAQP